MLDLHYKEFGQGEPLIILHGLFGSLDNWQTLAKKFAEHFTVFIIDQRNHGRSPGTDRHDYSSMAEDLFDFMSSKWIYKANLLGHSMGGKTVMRFATEYPDMVNKLIVADIAPKTYPDTHNLIFKALLSMDLATLKTRKEAEIRLMDSINSPVIRQFLLKNLTRDQFQQFKWKMNLSVLHKYYSNILKFDLGSEIFEGDTLFIKGGQSGYIQPEDMEFIRDYFPNANLKTIEKAGHWLHAEAPEQFFKMVQEFLSKHSIS